MRPEHSLNCAIPEMGFEPMHTICITPQPRCSPAELLKYLRYFIIRVKIVKPLGNPAKTNDNS